MPRHPKEVVQCAYFAWSLYRRDGVWYADGRPHPSLDRYSLATRDREVALENLRMLDATKAVELGLANATVLRGNPVSIERGWDIFLEFCGRSPVQGGVTAGTLVRYENVRKHHQPYCLRNGILTWNEFDRAALIRFGNFRGQSADATSFLELNVIKGVLKHLVGENLLPAECRITLPLRRPTESDTYCYTRQEMRAMLELCRTDPELAWLEPILLLLATTGMRIGEAANLRWSDIDFATNMLRVADERSSSRLRKLGSARTTKGRRSRLIPLYPQLKAKLVQLPRTPDGFVLHAPMGGKLHDGNLREVLVQRVLTPLSERFPTPVGEIGFIHGRSHSFRHYFCSEAFRCGLSEGDIRQWLGHADSRIAERYRHLRNDDAVAHMSRIDFFGNADQQSV